MAGFKKLTRKGNTYADIDNVSEELINVELDIDKKTGKARGYKRPEEKKMIVELDGKQFEVVPKINKAIKEIWDDIYSPYYNNNDSEDKKLNLYDPGKLLALCRENDIPTEGYTHEKTGDYIDAPIAELIWETDDLEIGKLSDETVQKRINAFVYILRRCCDEDVAKKIVEKAEKKKDGMLYKGRLQPIAHMNLVAEDGDTYVVVAKNDSDTRITIEVRWSGVNSTLVNSSDLYKSTKLFF